MGIPQWSSDLTITRWKFSVFFPFFNNLLIYFITVENFFFVNLVLFHVIRYLSHLIRGQKVFIHAEFRSTLAPMV